jgi:hypothetical protein
MVSAVSARIAPGHPQQTAIRREHARGVIIPMIFASGAANVERSSPQFPSSNFSFYGFACPPLLRIRIRVEVFLREKAKW